VAGSAAAVHRQDPGAGAQGHAGEAMTGPQAASCMLLSFTPGAAVSCSAAPWMPA
jgi:hypothetical protein